MVVIERLDPIPNGAQKLNAKQTEFEKDQEKVDKKEEQDEKKEEGGGVEGRGGVGEHEEMVESKSCDVIQEEDEDEKPLDLTTCMRRVDDSDIILISDTEEAPIVISDDSDNETDAELIEFIPDEQQMVSITYFSF